MILKKNNLTEKKIINHYLKKLNFNKQQTFNFENDAAYLKISNNKDKLAVTTDTILENIDFFKNDNPRSIAQKIMTVNLSDIFAMGAKPHSYVLNLCLPSYINDEWLKIFSNQLKKIQLQHNCYLLGGDLSKSNKLIISSTFFGLINKNLKIYQNKFNLNDDIWISGNIGDSKIGLEVLKKKFLIDKNLNKYFIDKYLYPKPCKLGPKVAKYCSSMKDISDGLVGDLKKILNDKAGALINTKSIPLSIKTKKIINNKMGINIENLLNAGDDYCLIIVSNPRNRKKIKYISAKNKIKISCIGKIIRKKGIHFDSLLDIDNFNEFDHFS